MKRRLGKVGTGIRKRTTVAERYLARTRHRLAIGYGSLLAILLIAIVGATYAAVRTHETTQIHGQLISSAQDKLDSRDLLETLGQAPQLKDEEEAVRTFVISRDGIVREADAVTGHPPDSPAVAQVLHGGGPVFTTITGPGGVLSVYTIPIRHGSTVVGVIQTITAEAPYHVILQYLLVVSLIVGGIGLLLAAALGLLMADWGLRPIRAGILSQQAFAQNAAHELRTPLTLIRTSAELALRSGNPGEMRDALATTVRQTEHLDAVVGDLRLVAQGDTGRLLVDVEPLDLVAVAREVYDEVRPTAEAHQTELQLDGPRVLRVMADRQRLRQLLMILTDNALRHTEPGGRIDIMLSQQDQKVFLTVQDTGSGIEPRHLPHLFDRFYRAEEVRSQHRGGAGLGLAIAREIVEAHGGQIAIRSRVGAGTAFRVTLPIDTTSRRPPGS